MTTVCRTVFAVLLALVAAVSATGKVVAQQPLQAANFPRWSITGFIGPMTTEALSSSPVTIFRSKSGLVGIAVSRHLFSHGAHLTFEGELELIQHFGGQDNFEANLVFIARWHTFPWNRMLPTTFALGLGPSLAFSDPKQEYKSWVHHRRFLNELLGEITIGAPGLPRWSLVGRLQHRSGVFGLYDGVTDASTAYAFGLKYRF